MLLDKQISTPAMDCGALLNVMYPSENRIKVMDKNVLTAICVKFKCQLQLWGMSTKLLHINST